MPTEHVKIIVTSSGTVTVRKDIDKIGTASRKAGGAVDFLKGAITAFLSVQTLRAFASLGDANTQLTNALMTTGLAGKALADQQSELFDIAKENGQSVNELAGIYQRLTSVQGQLDASGEDVDFTIRAIAASMRMSSSGAAAQAGALQQLQQLFGGTNVQAQEFNALIDGAYPLLQAVAAGSERWGGNVAKLTQDVKAGTVTSKEFFDALQKGGQANIDLANTFDLTIGQAITNFRTNVQQALLSLQNMTGVFSGTATAINYLGNNLIILGVILAPLIAALGVLAVQMLGNLLVAGATAAGNAIIGLGKAFLALNAFIIANPIAAAFIGVVAIIATIITAMGGWGDAIQLIIDGVNNIIKAFKYVAEIFGATFEKGEWEIKIKGEEIAEKIKGAAKEAADTIATKAKNGVSSGGSNAAKEMKNAIEAGGASAANSLKAAQDAAVLRYQQMNGVAVEALGDTLVDGGDYIYNQVDGSVREASGTLSENITGGGDIAGATIKDSIIAGGDVAAGQIFNTVESAFATLGPLIEVFRLAKDQLRADITATRADANLKNAQAAQIGRGGGTNGSGRGRGGGGLDNWHHPNGSNPITLSTPDTRAGPRTNDNSATPGDVSITNVVDPETTINTINTRGGNTAIVNVIKNNREDIQRILGVA